VVAFFGMKFIKLNIMEQYPLKMETGQIISAIYEVHKILGPGFLEIVYKDALEYEFKLRYIPYKREKSFKVEYKTVLLPREFFADFTIFEKVVLEVKAQTKITDIDKAQTINYLKLSSYKIGLLVNFGEMKPVVNRLIY